jgi:energy-coupling factor transporter ATP-binding protein EcfA2
MKIKAVHIRNFRSFEDQLVDLDSYTAFVGPNGAGKSTVLCALNVFFRDTESAPTNLSSLDHEDFHNNDTSKPIEITVTFCDLEDAAKEDFSAYSRNDELVVTAKADFDPVLRRADVKQFGQRFGMQAFADFFRLEGDKAPAKQLQAAYESLKAAYPDLPSASSTDARKQALRAYESDRPELCVLIPSEDQFYGFSKGANRLAKFVQWVYVPAVKDATTENMESKGSALGKILARTVRSKVNFAEKIDQLKTEAVAQYAQLLDSQQAILNDLSSSLSKKLSQWAHPGARARLEWSEDPKGSIRVDEPVAKIIAGEGSWEGELARLGHGLQRSYLLALLQELVSTDDSAAPRLILACEEPELYQHPPQARHLASVLQGLSEQNAQVLVTTHSPQFVSGKSFDHVRLVNRNSSISRSSVKSTSASAISDALAQATQEEPVPVSAELARLNQALQVQLNEMFFTPFIVFVEGLEDIAFLTSWMVLTDRWDAFRAVGGHFIASNGKGYLIEPLIVAKKLSIPCFVIFDADGNKTKESERIQHARDNSALLRILGGNPAAPFPDEPLVEEDYAVWPQNLGTQLKSDVDTTLWNRCYSDATKGLGDPEGSYAKNTLHIAHHLTSMKAAGAQIKTLDMLCDAIIAWGAAQNSPPLKT